jgi:hypothetical protein
MSTSAPDDRHDDPATEQQIVEPPRDDAEEVAEDAGADAASDA